MKMLNALQVFIVNLLSLIAFALIIYALLLEHSCDSKQPTSYKPKTNIDIESDACDYSIFYSPEDVKIARKGIMTSAYGDEMKFEYEGQEYVIKVKDVDKFIEFDKEKGRSK